MKRKQINPSPGVFTCNKIGLARVRPVSIYAKNTTVFSYFFFIRLYRTCMNSLIFQQQQKKTENKRQLWTVIIKRIYACNDNTCVFVLPLMVTRRSNRI